MLVSIITVCYNSEKYIEQTIKSVVSQTYTPIEYIIVDGISKDRTMDIIKLYAKKYPTIIKYLSEEDTGIYNAMNKGLQRAQGELIGIINSDDWYDANSVEKVVDAYKANGEAVYHGIQRVYKEDQLICVQRTSPNQLNERMIEHPTCFIPKSIYEKYGRFDESYQYVADYELMLRLRQNNVPFIGLDEILANFREGGASHRQNAVWENYKLWLKVGIMTRREYIYRSIMDRIKIYTGKIKQ